MTRFSHPAAAVLTVGLLALVPWGAAGTEPQRKSPPPSWQADLLFWGHGLVDLHYTR